MTIKEATIAALQVSGYSDSAIEKALLDNGLNGSDSYSSGNSKDVDLIAIEVLQGMLSVASVTEGGFSVSYSIIGIKNRLAYLSAKNGISDVTKPSISSPKVW